MKFLIANYGFPPNTGVGGRRWVKFAKYLAKAGHEVHVIHAAPAGSEVSTWEEDACTEGITRYALPRLHCFETPHLGNNQRISLTTRIAQRAARVWYRSTSTRRYYDQAFRWKTPFLTLANRLIEQHQIDVILATGAPFYLFEYCAILRLQHPELRLLCDLRDPWFGAINYGMADLKGSRLKNEQSVFQFVCRHADWMTAPNSQILELQSISGTIIPKSKRQVLIHAFDDDDLPLLTETPKKSETDSVRVVYGGAIYGKSGQIFDGISKGLDHIRKVDPAFYQRIQFDFYTNDRLPGNIVRQHGRQLNVTDQIGVEIHSRVGRANWTMLLAAGHYKDAMTTKFFEFGRCGTPFLVVGEEGELMATVREHSLGVCLPFEKLISEPAMLIEALKSDFNPQSAFFAGHSYKHRTCDLLNIVKGKLPGAV